LSCHVEFDFNDDGTVTVTHRRAKGEEYVKTVVLDGKPLEDGIVLTQPVAGGETNEHTHTIQIGTKDTMERRRVTVRRWDLLSTLFAEIEALQSAASDIPATATPGGTD
jgi:hypothetical protein